MGLKTDIEQAYIDNLGQSIYDQTTQGQKDKLSRLAEGLADAISSFIQAQTFTVTKLQASQQGVTTTPSLTAPTGIPQPPGVPAIPSTIPSLVIPNITVKIDEDGLAPDNALGGGKTESLLSQVRLKNIAPGSLS
tara:strand:+ start:849 stop:1253 length:405 start_codon:yes stop_codon:yes gene_type:complete